MAAEEVGRRRHKGRGEGYRPLKLLRQLFPHKRKRTQYDTRKEGGETIGLFSPLAYTYSPSSSRPYLSEEPPYSNVCCPIVAIVLTTTTTTSTTTTATISRYTIPFSKRRNFANMWECVVSTSCEMALLSSPAPPPFWMKN